MDPDQKELSLHRKVSSSPATKPSGRCGNPNPNLTEVAGEILAIDTNAKASDKPCEKAEAQSLSSLNPNVLEARISSTGETVSMDISDKPSSKPSDESMKVFLRIRPLVVSPHKSKSLKPSNDKIAWPKLKAGRGEKVKLEKKKTSCIEVCDCHSVTILPPSALHRMKSEVYRGFSQVFSADSSQEEVYAKTVRPVVEDFIRGKSGLLAASGPSGSGKTHTVFGSAREPGLVPRALRHIFHPSVGNQDGPKRSFYLSIFEIYVDHGKMEKLSDLSPDGGEVQLQQSGLKGLKELLITDYMQAEALIARAMLRRNIAMTNSNSQSSRSQCIIRIRCTFDNIDGKFETQINESVLTFVDLAGAEREKRTGNQGDRLLESNFINKTSMVFGLCLKSLLEHQKNPKKPLRKHFQSSLLTRYLRDYLEGKKRMALILTVRPAVEDYLDTSFLLRQASPYMEIKFLHKEEAGQSKRHYETMFNALPEQSKRMKILCHTNSMDKLKISAHASDTREEHDDGYPKKVSAKPRMVPVSKVKGEINCKTLEELDEGYPKKGSAKPRKVPVSKVNGEIVCKTHYSDSEKEREYKILSGVAKSIWSLLKEYYQKIKVLEKRNMELQNEISDLESCSCACQKEESVEVAFLVADTNSETTSLSEELVGHRSAASDTEGEIDVFKEIEKQVDKCKNGCDFLGEQRSTYLICKGDMEKESKSFSSEPVQLPGDHLSAFRETKQNEMVGEVEDGRPTHTRELEKKAHIRKPESEHPQDDCGGETYVFKDIEKQADTCRTGSDFPKEQTPTYLKCKGGMEMESRSYSSEPMQLPGDHLSAFHEAKQDEMSGEVEDYRPTNTNELEKKVHICETLSEHPQDDSEGEIDVSKEIEKQAGTCKIDSEFPKEQSSIYLTCIEMEVKSYNSEPRQFLEDHLCAFNVAKQNEMVEKVEDSRPTNMMELEKKVHICKTEPEHPQDECRGSPNLQGNVSNDGSYQGYDLEKEDNKEACSDKILKASYEKMPKSSSDLSSAIASKSDRQPTCKNGKQKKYINCEGRGNFNSASEPGKILIPREKSSVKTKLKRRLMPASSVLLRHVSNLDFKDGGGTVVGRRERSSAADDNIRATSSASLLRLLRVDAHR